MIHLKLHWNRDGETVDLGSAYHPLLPPPGTLLAYTGRPEHATTWRVLFAYMGLIEEGSAAYYEWASEPRPKTIWVDVFVEPAEGPFES